MEMINVCADLSGNVWKIEVSEGDKVSEGDVLVILESMKMEIPMLAPEDGVVNEIRIKEGDVVTEGQIAVILSI